MGKKAGKKTIRSCGRLRSRSAHIIDIIIPSSKLMAIDII
jgi:hypothetical protein